MMRYVGLVLPLIFWLLSVAPAAAQNCTATFTNLNFGTVTLRSGVSNETSGSVALSCNSIPTPTVGICLEFADGTGGSAGPSQSPRFMRNTDNDPLSYEMRLNGNGAGNGTLTAFFTTISTPAGSGSGTVPIFADIVSSGVGINTGSYTSVFIVADLTLTFDVSACGQIGTSGNVTAFTVTADVADSCEVDGSTLDFGTLPELINTAIDATGQIDVRCTDQTASALRLGLGDGPGVSDPTARKMANGASELIYGLYQNAARSLPWGSLTTNDVDETGSGSTQSYPVFGRIPSGQTAVPGIYSDNVVVTIEY